MFLYPNNMLPSNFNSFFSTVNKIHNYNTHQSKMYYVPLCRTKIIQFSVVYQGVLFFNSLGNDIRDASSISSFKRKLKEYLLNI